MYQYQYAVGRYRDYQPGYHLVDISQFKLSDVAKTFNLLDVIVFDDVLKKNVRINLDDYFDNFMQETGTIIDFLTKNGNNTLKVFTDIPKNEYQYARWESPYHKAFYIHPANVNLSNDTQLKLTPEAAPDIRFVKDDRDYTDYKTLADYTLCIVNGTFVRHYGNKDGLYLLGAGDTFRKFKEDIYASVINFEKIGKITTIPITKAMINHITADGTNRYLLSLDPNLDLSTKTMWIVFNGQLCVDQDIFSHIGKNIIQFRPEYIDMMSHYLTFKQYTRTPLWTDQSKREQYVEDCLVMDNSFIVLIDNPTVGVELTPLTTALWPSAAISNTTFEHPIMLENGTFPYCYRRTYGNRSRMINFDIHHEYKPVLDSAGNLSSNLVYDETNKGMMGKLPTAYEFKITGLNYE